MVNKQKRYCFILLSALILTGFANLYISTQKTNAQNKTDSARLSAKQAVLDVQKWKYLGEINHTPIQNTLKEEAFNVERSPDHDE